jgi:hypothetical protein
MPPQDKLDPATRALIAEAEERVKTRSLGNGTRMSDEELGRWIDELQARLDKPWTLVNHEKFLAWVEEPTERLAEFFQSGEVAPTELENEAKGTDRGGSIRA